MYYDVRYDIKVVIGPADLRFELCEFTCRRGHCLDHKAKSSSQGSMV